MSEHYKQFFHSHSQIDISCSQWCLYICPRGILKREDAEQSKKVIENTVNTHGLRGKRWGAIADFRQFERVDAEALPFLRASYIWRAANGQRFEARIQSGVVQQEFTRSLNAESMSNFEIQYFDSVEQAEHWMRQRNVL